ncbi:MAG: hypothetical protein ACLRTQ_04610 [Candidatus Borkfalkia sp.]
MNALALDGLFPFGSGALSVKPVRMLSFASVRRAPNSKGGGACGSLGAGAGSRRALNCGKNFPQEASRRATTKRRSYNIFSGETYAA